MNGDTPIILPTGRPLPPGTYDRFRDCSWLTRPRTNEILVLSIVFTRRDDEVSAVYRIVDAVGHRNLAEIVIDSDEEARYLYHRFRSLNPEFIPCSQERFIREGLRARYGRRA